MGQKPITKIGFFGTLGKLRKRVDLSSKARCEVETRIRFRIVEGIG